MKNKIIIGSRQSALALCQTHLVSQLLKSHHPELEIVVKKITTTGDRDRTSSLTKIGGKGVFVKEIEQEMLDHQIDFAVHSLKDVMPVLPVELMLGAFPKRANPYDCLATRGTIRQLEELPQGARIGTNSVRRIGQLLHVRPDLTIVPIRGNVETRLQKLTSEHLDGVVLARAGIERLRLSLRGLNLVDLQTAIVPAVGQGIMTVECRKDDQAGRQLLAEINDPQTAMCAAIERSFMRQIGGNCSFPIGGFARPGHEGLTFTGLIASPDGKHLLKKTIQNTTPEEAARVAEELLAMDQFGIIEGK